MGIPSHRRHDFKWPESHMASRFSLFIFSLSRERTSFLFAKDLLAPPASSPALAKPPPQQRKSKPQASSWQAVGPA
jgi:hypothetical protein